MRQVIGAVSAAVWLLGLAHAAGAQERMIGAKEQQVIYVAVEVNDFARALKFYTDVIGLKPIGGPGTSSAGGNAAPQFVIVSFSGTLDDATLVIRQLVKPSHTERPFVGLKVTDIRAVLTLAREAGFVVLNEPAQAPREPSLLYAILEDQDGNKVELLQKK